MLFDAGIKNLTINEREASKESVGGRDILRSL